MGRGESESVRMVTYDTICTVDNSSAHERAAATFVRSSSSFVRSSRYIRAQQQVLRAQQNCPSGPPYI